MMYICTVLYIFLSAIVCKNITDIIELTQYDNCKFRVTPFILWYILFAVVYPPLCYRHPDSVIPLVILILYYISLFLHIKQIFRHYSLKGLLFVFGLYITTDALLQSVLQNIILITNIKINYLLLTTLTEILINIILILTIKFILTKNKENFQLVIKLVSSKTYILIIITIIINGLLMANQSVENNNHQITRTLTILSVAFLISIIIALLVNCISKKYFTDVSELLEKQVETQLNYYNKIENMNEEIRKFRHDYKNHMICLQALIKQNDIQEAEQYIKNITNKEIINANRFFTGNKISDSILTDKQEYADIYDIIIDFEGSISDKVPASDLCVILSNSIDNAIEACQKINALEPKVIKIKCAFIKRIQIIQISNPIIENYNIINDSIPTSKSDKNMHGFGLYNIKKTINKYNGNFNIKCENNHFVLEVGFQI